MISDIVLKNHERKQQFLGYSVYSPILTCDWIHEEGFLVNRIWEILTFWCLLCSTLKATQEGLTKR